MIYMIFILDFYSSLSFHFMLMKKKLHGNQMKLVKTIIQIFIIIIMIIIIVISVNAGVKLQ